MQCPTCDATIPDDSQFCIICGAAVAPAATGKTQRMSAAIALDPAMVTSAFTLPGYRIVRSLGIVRGLTVRSANLGGQVVASLQSLFGGTIRPMTNVCEHARTDAFLMVLEHAAQLDANAIVGFGYDTTEIAQGMTEVLAYGTAVVVEPEQGDLAGPDDNAHPLPGHPPGRGAAERGRPAAGSVRAGVSCRPGGLLRAPNDRRIIWHNSRQPD